MVREAPERGQYREDIVHTQDGRGFIAPKCGRYTPVWFELQDGRVFYGRYAAGAFQTFECGLGRVITLVEGSVGDVGFRQVANQIPWEFLPAAGTAAGPREGEPAATGVDDSGTVPAGAPQAPPPLGEPAAAGLSGIPREAPPATGADASESKAGRLDEPSPKAFAAYRAVRLAGQRQAEVAKRSVVSQGTISRWVAQVADWIKAGNVLPDLDAPRPRVVPMDPAKLEQGPRRR
jgi:hypothetical protein